MKKLIGSLIVIAIIICGFLYHENIVDFVIDNIIAPKKTVEYKANEYYSKNNYNYLKINDSFIPQTEQDIMNIIYTRLNQGLDEFYFYCDEDVYPNCIEDVKKITSDSSTLSEVNNFVHPFNSYNKLSITFDSFGKINFKIDKLYTDEEIKQINQKVNEVINTYITDDMSDVKKIRTIHDYIINTTKYDDEKAEAIKNNQPLPDKYLSQKAYGPLIQNMGICGGYSDAMAIFLTRFGIENYKIASSNHVWNLVKVNENWYHLDLTWDDPVTSDGSDAIIDDFFLIDTYTLQNRDLTQHSFNRSIYQEAT